MATNTIDSKNGDHDIEAGNNGRLYPTMTESPALRWAFIRKVYVILLIQLLLTVAVSATVVFVRPIPHFVLHTIPGTAIFVVVIILPLILLCPLHAYRKHHPVNLIVLALFTIAVAFSVGLSCSTSKGRVILEAAILTSVVAVSLTLYTFWAVKRGQDFSFLGPFLFTSLWVLIVFALIQVCFPLGKFGLMIYALFAAIIFCGFIIFDTEELIKRLDYDEYVWAAAALYLDIINLFLQLLSALGGSDSS